MSSHKGKKLNQWNEERMKGAIREFEEGKLSLRLIARAWNVPRATLHKRVKGLVLGHKHSPSNNSLLPARQETELADLLVKLAQRGFPLSPVRPPTCIRICNGKWNRGVQ